MKEIRRLGESDLDQLVRLRLVSFPGPSEDLLRRVLSTRLPYTTGLFLDGKLACCYTDYPVRAFVAGETVPVGALAGVASAVEHRRGGLVRELLLHDLEQLRDSGTGWSLEYPFDPAFYGRLGWQSIPSGVHLDLPPERLHSSRPAGAEQLPLERFAQMGGLFRSWATRFAFALDRDNDPRDSWRRIVSQDWLDSHGHLYSFPDGYLLLTLEREQGQLVAMVEDYAYSSPDGRDELLALLGGFRGQADKVRILVPEDDPLALLYGRRFVRPGRPLLQARIVDLQLALSSLPARTSAATRLRVVDEQCHWNDGTFVIEGAEGSLTATRSNGSARTTVPIQTMVLLLTGVVSASQAIGYGIAEGDRDDLAALEGIALRQPIFVPMADSF